MTPLSPDAALARLEQASRRGRLPGFRPRPAGAWAEAAAFGGPFDGRLLIQAEPGPTDAPGTRLRPTLRLDRRMRVFFAAALAFTVFPGVYLTDETLFQLAPGLWHVLPATWTWYLPLTILPIPWAWRRAVRRSRAAADTSAREALAKIARDLDGRLVPRP